MKLITASSPTPAYWPEQPFHPAFGRTALATNARKQASNLFSRWGQKTTEEKLVVLNGFLYVPSAILTPVVTDTQLKLQKTPEYERKLMVNSEVVRQIISATIHFIGFFGGISIAKAQEKVKNKGNKIATATSQKASAMRKFWWSLAGITLMSAIIKPFFLNAYIDHWIKGYQAKAPQQPRLPLAEATSPPMGLSAIHTLRGMPQSVGENSLANKQQQWARYWADVGFNRPSKIAPTQ